MKLKLLSLVFVTLLFSCKCSKEKTGQMKTLESGMFNVVSIAGNDVSQDNVTMKIDLEANRISGNGGCNDYSADFKVDGKTIDMGFARATRMICKNKMDVESSFFKGLKDVKTYSYDGKMLQLKSEEGKTLITAKK